ncbi:hypothetical protein ATERTT37_007232 [Aspergillus terreus]|jgi:hypothetical protein
MKGLLFACGLLATMASAHIQMVDPIPIRSPESKDKSGQIDYSYTNPLSDSGSDYPCKGYANDPFKSVANYSPGQQYSLKLKGSATHDGGSCQISLSYDKGKSFKVIHSMLGGCPLTKEYQFQIPQGAPSGEALLAWTWFNKVGNREMYMNCAQVTIGGGNGGQRSAKEEKAITRRDGLDSLPPMFIANVNGPGKCKTIEGEDVNFPMPGQSVEGKASGKGYKCEGSAPFLGDGGSSQAPNDNKNSGQDGNKNNNNNKSNNTNGNNGNNNGNNKNQDNANNGNKNNNNANANGPQQNDKPSTHSTARKELVHKVPMPFGDNVKNGDVRTASIGTQDSPSWLAAAEGCNGNGLICAPDGQTWALCNDGKPVHMGNVAAGTTCTHGAIQHAAMEPAA